MDFNAALGEVFTQLDTIAGLRTSSTPPDDINPPCAFPNGDGQVRFDANRGLAQLSLPILVAVARSWTPQTWKQLLAYASGTGTQSISATLDAGSWTEFDSITIREIDFGEITIGGISYVSVAFTVDIVGSAT